jgi:2-keto-4-pentenoate hydratase
MNEDSTAKAASLLAAARRTGTPLERLPDDCRPATIEEALAIQDALVRTLGERVAGYKVARLPGGHLAHGVIVGSRVIASGGEVDARDVPLLGMEAEIAFRFLRDVPPRAQDYSYEEVAERVVAFPALEIVATRYRDYLGTPVIERAADFMSNGAFVVGADQPQWRSMDLVNLAVSLSFDDGIIAERTGGHVTGDPLLPAVDLVNALRASGGVRAGQMMTTGTYTGLNFATAGQRVTARFEGFAPVTVSVR